MSDLQDDLNRNYPSSEMSILGVNEESPIANQLAASVSDIPLLHDSNSDVWQAWGVTYNDVQVVNADRELADVFNLDEKDVTLQADYDDLRELIVDVATSQNQAESAWQNRVEPYDVSNDGFVVPRDVLIVINRINSEGAGELPTPPGTVPFFYDVNGDNFVSPIDALRVIRHINKFSLAAGEAEDKSANASVRSTSVSAPAAVDAVFALAAMGQQDNTDDNDDDMSIESSKNDKKVSLTNTGACHVLPI